MDSTLSTNHKTFYYKDGTIAFGCVNQTGSMTYYRIHQSYLASQSTVVADMLELPKEGGQQELYDGVPLVKFPETITAEAMELFLTFFYEPVNSLLASDDDDIAFKLFDVLVLADMLMVDKIKTTIIRRIKEDWNISSIKEWQRRFTTLNPEPKLVYCFYEPASVIRVARRFDSTLITTLQFFELSVRDHLLPYQPGADEPPEILCTNPGARWELISVEDKRRTGRGHLRFMKELSTQLKEIVSPIQETAWGTQQVGPCFDNEDDNGSKLCELAIRERYELAMHSILCGGHPFVELERYKIREDRGFTVDTETYHPDAIHAGCAKQWDGRIDESLEYLFNKLSDCYKDLV